MLNIDREIVLKKIVEFLIVIFLALFVGVTVGVVETVFSFGVMHIGELHSQYNYYLTPFLFLAALFLTYIYKNFGGKANMGPNLMFKVSRGEEDRYADEGRPDDSTCDLGNSPRRRKCR
jgi:hypothetical protein